MDHYRPIVDTRHETLLSMPMPIPFVTIPFAGESELEPVLAAPFNFVTTKPHGTGKALLHHGASVEGEFKHWVAATDFIDMTLRFTLAELAGIGQGAKFEITIPEPWPLPFVPIGDNSADGALTAVSPGVVTVDGRTIKGDFVGGGPTVPEAPTITYRVKTAPGQGAYTFPAKASAGHHGDPAPITPPSLELVVGHALGSVALTKGGVPFSQTPTKTALGNLVFTFTSVGYMAIGSQVMIALPVGGGWTAFREDNADGIADAGEATISGSATLAVAADGQSITATTNAVLMANNKLVFTYKTVTAPDIGETSRSYQFAVSKNSYPGVALLPIGGPNVGIGRAPDGGGTLALSVTDADAGSFIDNIKISYTAAGTMEAGSEVEITLPTNGGWPKPNLDVSEPGGVSLDDRSSTLTVTDTTMKATTAVLLNAGDKIHFNYKNITAPSDGGTYTFTGASKSSSGGTLSALASGVTMTINEVAAGTVALNGPEGAFSSSAPGTALGNLVFTFTAGARMDAGAKVEVTIPGSLDTRLPR